jgi:hypothetical protein
VLSGDAHKAWNWNRGETRATASPAPRDDLARAMRRNPHLRVLVASGRYDLGTPYSATDWSLAQLDAPPTCWPHHPPLLRRRPHDVHAQEDLAQLKADLAAWLGG